MFKHPPLNDLRGIHVVVDDWVDHGMRHGEPVEREKDVLDVPHVHHGGVVVGVDEVGVVRQPTDAEDQDEDNQHLDDLKLTIGLVLSP